MGYLFVLSAPSGAGKTTVAQRVLKEVSSLERVITATTRPKREGEKEGVDYLFMSKEEFEKGIKEELFLEHAFVYGNYYGTPKESVEKILKKGFDALLVIDVQGAKSVKEKFPQSVLIFLLPPSLEELKRRLVVRGYKEENLKERESKVMWEVACAKHFDYIVVNEFLDRAVEAIVNIINSYKYKKERVLSGIEELVKDENIRDALLKGECEIFKEGKKC